MTRLVSIVTGGSSGIGEGICRHLLQSHATVINVDLKSPGVKPQGDYHFFQCDLSDPAATRHVAREITARFQVNCLVNNAGDSWPAPIEEINDEEFDRSVNLHLRAALILTQAVVPGMKARRFGRILNMSSRNVFGKKGRTSYSGTKSALVGYTRTWALELGDSGITVNAVAPGPVSTEMFRKNNPPEAIERLIGATAVGRVGTPDDIARAVLFLVSPDNGYITGQLLHVCGGSTLGGAPW